MISRRVLLRNGGMALVSLGFAPGVRDADGGRGRQPAQAADHDLPARRRRRPEHRRPVRRARLLRGAADDRDRRSRAADATARRSISTASSACTRAWRRSCRSGSSARSPSSTPADRTIRRGRTSTRRTTWRAARRA